MAVFRRLLSYVWPHRRIVVLAIVAMIVHAGADAVVPFLMSELMAQLQSGGSDGARVAILLVVAFPIRGAADVAAVYAYNWVAWSVVYDLRRALFAQYLRLPSCYLDAHSSASLISTLTYNTEQLAEAISGTVAVVRDALVVIVLFGVMFYMSLGLTLVAAILAPVIWYSVSYASRALRRVSARIQASMSDFTQTAQQMLGGHRIIKIFAAHNYVIRAFRKLNERNARLHLRLATIRALQDSLTAFFVALGMAAIVFAALSRWVLPEIDAPTFIGFISAMGMLLAPLRRLTNTNALIQRAIVAAAGVFETLDARAETDSGTRRLGRAEGHIEFRNVSFRFRRSGEYVLKNVSIDVPAGSMVVVVGRSGSGKSTFASLLGRFYEVEAGAILLDGRDIRTYARQDLRRQLSVVGQDVVLFDDTIANNIAYGALARHTRQEIEHAADVALVTEFASALPHGLDTRVGEHGVLLSGGQRQRIAIARAFLKDAPLLILDEATSELDSESERHIHDALARVTKRRTIFLIAHRLGTVRRADCIVVLNNGEIVEAGTHHELMQRGGYYASLQRVDAASRKARPDGA